MKDTLRILVSWECNLNCTYCCNKQPRFRKDIVPTTMENIRWDNYQNFCITGGEPLLRMDLVREVCKRIPKGKTIIFYTNGRLLTRLKAMDLMSWGIQYVNVGLHSDHVSTIKHVQSQTWGTTLKIRYHAQDTFEKALPEFFPGVNFRFWKMDDCDRANEDRIVLI